MASPSPTTSPNPSPTATPSPTPDLAPLDGGGLPPRSFPGSIPRPDELSLDLTVAGQSLLLALLFLVLAAFPGQLANKTWEANREEISRWFARGGLAADRVRTSLASFWKRPYGILIFVALTAALYGFLSPEFGPSIESAVALLGILGGLGVVILAFELPLFLAYRRINREMGRLRVVPMTIILGIACVVISRIAEFQPGYLYGLVATFAFTGSLQRRDEARAHALTGVWMLMVALAAWLAMPWIEQSLASERLLLMGISAGLATVFVGGLEGLLFELVPLRFLRGEAVYEWRRSVWAILFLAAGFCFAYILLDPSHGYLGSTRVSPLIPALILFVSFGIASILFWAYFRFRPTRTAAA